MNDAFAFLDQFWLTLLLVLPVVLVIDARGITRGIAPLVLGYQAFDRAIEIAGRPEVDLVAIGAAEEHVVARAGADVDEDRRSLPPRRAQILGAAHAVPEVAGHHDVFRPRDRAAVDDLAAHAVSLVEQEVQRPGRREGVGIGIVVGDDENGAASGQRLAQRLQPFRPDSSLGRRAHAPIIRRRVRAASGLRTRQPDCLSRAGW